MPDRRRLVFRCSRRTFFVLPGDVTCILAEGKYSRIQTLTVKSLLVREVIGSIASRLDTRQFFRAHRSSIVNLDRVIEIRTSARKLLVVLSDGTQLPLAPGKREELERILAG